MYYFFLGVLPLPVTPGALDISTPSMNKTVTLINDGEINILKKPGLKTISFEFLLPQQKYPFANYSVAEQYTATTAIPALNALRESNIPFPFIVTRLKPNGDIMFFTSIMCQIEELTYKEDAEAYGFDVQCAITLKEYRFYSTNILNWTGGRAGAEIAAGVAATALVATVTKTRDTSSKTTPKTYTVKKGDTLWNICKTQLGDGQKYKEIAKLNNISNPDLIHPGQKLRLE